MKRMLTKVQSRSWYFVNGQRIDGCPPTLRGDVSGLSGDLSGLSGDVSGLRGDVSGGLRGDVSGLRGDLDDCDPTDDERECGIDIAVLIATH